MQKQVNNKSGEEKQFFAKPTFLKLLPEYRGDKAIGFEFRVGGKRGTVRRDDKGECWVTCCSEKNMTPDHRDLLDSTWVGQPFRKLRDAMMHVAQFYGCIQDQVVQGQILQPRRIEA